MGSEEWSSGYGKSGQPWLPPGFRFHPTDEELVTCYLAKKVEDDSFTDPAIAEVDINKCEPWELPAKAKMGEKEWYFYTLLDRKYPTGMRTNRATNAGYWKATGKDREVLSSVNNNLVGMKKTLVFYKGRAPKGEKTNWVMHEYRLEGATLNIIPRTSKEERVVCRVFKKSMAETKVCFYEDYASSSSSSLPPLLDSPHHHHFSEGVVYNPSDFFSTKASYNNSHLQSINPHLDEALPWMKILMDDYNEEGDQHDQVNHSSAQNKLKRKLSDSGLLFEDMLHEHLQEHQFKQQQRQKAYNDDITGLGQQLLEEEADIINPISNSN